MQSIYASYICCMCRKEFVLLSEDVEVMQGYLVCPYCSSRNIKREKVTDSLKECMEHSSYKIVKGALRQK